MDSKKVTLTQELEAFAKAKGAELFGVADLSQAREFMVSQGNPIVEAFPLAVSLGMPLNDYIVVHHSPAEPRRQSLYWHHVYDVVTPALDLLAYDVTKWLTGRGFSTLSVPGSTPYNLEKLEGIFPHKLAAHLAGLGWIGKSCLLLTDQFGPRVRFVTVLTDAPLTTGSPLDKACGKCHVCVDSCPVTAFTGREFYAYEPRAKRFDAFKCSEYRRDHPCGICVSSCPMGSRPVRKKKGLLS